MRKRRFMPEERLHGLSERIRSLARFLHATDATRVRVEREDEEIEVELRPQPAAAGSQAPSHAPADAGRLRMDTIKADLVGIFHVSRPVPAEGDRFESDRELGYIEALGIRTPVHSMGAGRIVAITAADGTPVEYGQPLFLVARRAGQ
jgi:acetyl-CoA carboxylase biotin carboxyl carrier protein